MPCAAGSSKPTLQTVKFSVRLPANSVPTKIDPFEDLVGNRLRDRQLDTTSWDSDAKFFPQCKRPNYNFMWKTVSFVVFVLDSASEVVIQ